MSLMTSRRLISTPPKLTRSYRLKAELGKSRLNVRLGQKHTSAPQKIMSSLPPNSDRESGLLQKVLSALPPKADICSGLTHVRFGPKADIGTNLVCRYSIIGGLQVGLAENDLFRAAIR